MHNKHHTKEAIEKIRLARAKQIITIETKKKISKALKGRTVWNKGKKMPKSYVEKRRELAKQEWQNPLIRWKRVKGMRGRKLTKATREKIGKANKEKWLTKPEEEKEKFKKEAKERQIQLWQNDRYRKMMVESNRGKIGYWRNKKRPEITGGKMSFMERRKNQTSKKN